MHSTELISCKLFDICLLYLKLEVEIKLVRNDPYYVGFIPFSIRVDPREIIIYLFEILQMHTNLLFFLKINQCLSSLCN